MCSLTVCRLVFQLVRREWSWDQCAASNVRCIAELTCTIRDGWSILARTSRVRSTATEKKTQRAQKNCQIKVDMINLNCIKVNTSFKAREPSYNRICMSYPPNTQS